MNISSVGFTYSDASFRFAGWSSPADLASAYDLGIPFDAKGNAIFSSTGEYESQLRIAQYPYYFALDPKGNIWLTATEVGQAQRWS